MARKVTEKKKGLCCDPAFAIYHSHRFHGSPRRPDKLSCSAAHRSIDPRQTCRPPGPLFLDRNEQKIGQRIEFFGICDCNGAGKCAGNRTAPADYRHSRP